MTPDRQLEPQERLRQLESILHEMNEQHKIELPDEQVGCLACLMMASRYNTDCSKYISYLLGHEKMEGHVCPFYQTLQNDIKKKENGNPFLTMGRVIQTYYKLKQAQAWL